MYRRSFTATVTVTYWNHIISYQAFLVRPLLREPRPQVHYKSQTDATAQRETQKSTNVKSLTSAEESASKSQQGRYQVTVLDKLFIAIIPLHQATNLVAAVVQVARVTAGLAESNGSLPSGL